MSEPTEQTEEENNPTEFGDTSLGEGLGCGFIILSIGAAIALIIWASHTFQ